MQMFSVNDEKNCPPNNLFLCLTWEASDVSGRSLEASQPHKIANSGSASAPEAVARPVGGSLDSVMINSSAVLCCLVWYAKKRVKTDDIQIVCFYCMLYICMQSHSNWEKGREEDRSLF